jgi:hypothetical protein
MRGRSDPWQCPAVSDQTAGDERLGIAGLPTSVPDSQLLETTAPAPTTTPSPNFTPLRIIACAPMKHPFPMEMARAASGIDGPQEVKPVFAWKSLSNNMAPAPMMVPSPITISFSAQMTAPLIPTFGPSTRRAPGASVLKTHGRAFPKGLHRSELKISFFPSKMSVEPGNTVRTGLPRNVTGPRISAPRRRASNSQSLDGARRSCPRSVANRAKIVVRTASRLARTA